MGKHRILGNITACNPIGEVERSPYNTGASGPLHVVGSTGVVLIVVRPFNEMKKFLLILLLLIPQGVSAQEQDKLNLVFSSPDKSCVLRYKGASRGTAGYYHVLENEERLVYKGYFHYGPIVSWISNRIAELRIPSGSPNYNSYFYDCESKKLSPEYMLPIAVDATNSVVATLDSEVIIFYKLFTQAILYRIHVPKLEPMRLLVFCESNARFEQNGTFILNYKCPDEPIKKVTIRKELLGQK